MLVTGLTDLDCVLRLPEGCEDAGETGECCS